MQIDFEKFKEEFKYYDLQVKAAKRIYFTKYLLIQMINQKTGEIHYFQKTSSDLRKCYKSVKTYFKNFPIENRKHDENLKNIITFAKEELENKNSLLLEFLYAFLFKTKNYTVFSNLNEFIEDCNSSLLNNSIEEEFEGNKKKNSFADSNEDTNENIIKHLKNITENHQSEKALVKLEEEVIRKNSSMRLIRNSLVMTNLKNRDMKIFKIESSEEELEKVLNLIFKEKKNFFVTNFYRLCNFEKIVNKLKIETNDYELSFKNIPDRIFKERYLFIDDFGCYFYKSKKRFLINKEDFIELLFILRIDEISFQDLENEYTLVYLNNKLNYRKFEILIKKEKKTLFLLRISQEILKKKSKKFNFENLPNPCVNMGNFIVTIKKTDDKSKIFVEESQRTIKIISEFTTFTTNFIKSTKTLIFPILNIYECYTISTYNSNYILETQKIFEQENAKNCFLKHFEFFNILSFRESDYLNAFVVPPLLNYHENRKLDSNTIKENIKELKLCTFRMKRLQAIKSFTNQSYSEFLNFKFPRFTSTMLLIIALYNIFFSFSSFLFFSSVCVFFYNHPLLKGFFTKILEKYLISPEFINKDFIEAKHRTERWLSKDFYFEMENLDPKIKRKKPRTSISEHFRNTVDFSSRVAANVHFFIDYIEKIKNIFIWKNPRKSQLFFFIFVLAIMTLYIVNLNYIVIIYITYLFWKGKNYYKKLKEWNLKVLVFFINYFLFNVFDYKKNENNLSYDKFFDVYQNNQECKEKFSKQFSENIEKYFDIRFEENFWLNRFSFAQICEELLNTNSRFIFPFFEEKRKDSYIYMVYYFIFSTPSDLYNYNLDKLKTNS